VRVTCEWEFGHTRRGLTRCTVPLDKTGSSFRGAGEARESGISCRKSQLQELFTAHALEHEQSKVHAILLRKEEAYAARRSTIDICLKKLTSA
jgi:hypothetical protein